MKLIINFLLLLLYIATINSSVYTNLHEDLLSFLEKSVANNRVRLHNDLEDDDDNDVNSLFEKYDGNNAADEDYQVNTATITPAKKMVYYAPDTTKYDIERVQELNDVKKAQKKAKVLMRSRAHDEALDKLNITKVIQVEEQDTKQHYRVDPVMNLGGSRRQRKGTLRKKSFRKKYSSGETSSDSSSRELKDWKQEFKEQWLEKKFQALNQTETPNRGDQVNMVAARPWGVPCGDPNQHDMPWGTCMLSMECEPEFRIYRGDFVCGRTRFVCCAIQLTNYDLYQGFDISLDDKSLSTDSEEKRYRDKDSNEKRKRKKRKEAYKRRRDRLKRKKKIKKNIRKIIKEIRKILNKQYRNGTRQRKKKTKLLKKFVKKLKKQYKKDRQSVKDLHEEELIRIDAALQGRLNKIREMNEQFMRNATFRSIIVNGTMNHKTARMLVEAYPELDELIKLRRSGGGSAESVDSKEEYLEYDIEYGYLYE